MNHLNYTLVKETIILLMLSFGFTAFFMWFQQGISIGFSPVQSNPYIEPLAYLIGFNVGLKFILVLFKSYVENRQIHWLMTICVGIPLGFILSHLIILLADGGIYLL